MSLCPEKEELSAFVDGEVSKSRCDEIESHIKTCEVCSKTVNCFLTIRNCSAFKKEDFYFDEEKSFENLKIKMRFSRFRNDTKPRDSSFSAGIAVAAAVILAFIPIYGAKKDSPAMHNRFPHQNFAFQTGAVIPNDVTGFFYPEVATMSEFYQVSENSYDDRYHHRNYRKHFKRVKPPFPENGVFVSPHHGFSDNPEINVELLRDTGIIQIDKPGMINVAK